MWSEFAYMSKTERQAEYVKWANDIVRMRYSMFKKTKRFEREMKRNMEYVDELEAMLKDTMTYYNDINPDIAELLE